MKLAIMIGTYQRPDGNSPFYLKRAIDSVFAQEHQDFKLYVIGDKYENNQEFLDILSSYPKDKLYYENLPVAVEREKYTSPDQKHILWCTAGERLANYTHGLILNDGFDYICHLDHDDYWTPRHLKVLSEIIERTKSDWMCTKSTYRGRIFPTIDDPQYLIPFLPLYEGLIQSSSCYNYRTIPLRPRNTYEEDGAATPADADLWRRMAPYIIENKLVSFLINEQTCFHDEECYIWKGKKG